MATALSLGPERLGLLGGSEIGAIAIASVLSPLWIKRIRWPTAALIGGLITVLGDLLTYMLHTYAPILAIRVFTGFLGEGILYSLSFAVLGQTRDPDRSFGIALSCSVAFLAVILMGSPWLTAAFGSSVLILILAGLGAAAAWMRNWIPDRLVRVDTRGGEVSSIQRGWKPYLFPLWGLIGQAVWFIGPGGYWAFAERVAAEHGLTPNETATALSFGLAAGLIGCLIPARIGSKYGRIWPVVVSTIGLSGVVVVMLRYPGPAAFIICILLFNVLWNLGTAYVFGIIASSDRDGRLAVLIPASQSFGLAAGPMIMGFLVGLYGIAAISWSYVAAGIASLALFIPFAQRVVKDS